LFSISRVGLCSFFNAGSFIHSLSIHSGARVYVDCKHCPINKRLINNIHCNFLLPIFSKFLYFCVSISHIVQNINFPILLFYGSSIAICFSMCNFCLDHSSLSLIPSVCATQLSGVLVTLGSPSSGGELGPRTWVLPESGGQSPHSL